jgi:hypothetical protein
MCIRPYHALIPQLDLIGTQWGVSIEDVLSQNNFGSPKSERKVWRRQSNQEHTEHSESQTNLNLDNNHLWKLTHQLRDLLQGALNEGRPWQQPTKAAPSRIHLLLDLRTLRGALNKRV